MSHIAEKYNFRDFTLKNYKRILKIAKNNFIFQSFDSSFKKKNILLWRHDVDYSLKYALELAKIEHSLGVKSTYFILIHNNFYNAFDAISSERIKRIIKLGHAIAIHFDPHFYRIRSKKQLEYYLTLEKKIFKELWKINVSVFSFHNPDKFILTFRDFTYAGLINTYSGFFQKKFTYCSDSNGYWRYNRLEDLLLKPDVSCAQILTHPGWWQETEKSPKKRIEKIVHDLSSEILTGYDGTLKRSHRKNIN
ncbi:MAG: hypothetical protein HYY40_10255 [Bacteroidetes bacterium]|nr:hypothetical protein [Bacteroidota bacterium]